MGYINPSVQPTLLISPTTVTFTVDSSVSQIAFTSDGTSPGIAKYIAYDNLSPSNPFIATVQDGKGNVLFDGGFPKWYNQYCNAGWQTYYDMSDTYKYFANALNWIANPDKIKQGNRKVLFAGDAAVNESYSINSTASTGFKTSITTVCRIMNYTPILKSREMFSGGVIDLSYSELDQYCAIFLLSSVHTSSQLISDNAVSNILASREAGNGLFVLTDHGDAYDVGFYRTANFIARNLGANFTGNFDRSPVNVGYLIDHYGNHPLWANMSRDGYVYAGSSESKVVLTNRPVYTPQTIPSVTINTDGFTTLRFSVQLNDGNFYFESYSYGLNTADIINLPTTINNGQTPNTLLNYFDIDFDISLISIANQMQGFVKKNGKVICEFTKTSTTLTKNWLTLSTNNRVNVANGDVISIEVNTPIYYSKTYTINRYQPDMNSMSYSQLMKNMKTGKLQDEIPNELTEEFLVETNLEFDLSESENIKHIRNYIQDK